jgi:hypothetical protein
MRVAVAAEHGDGHGSTYQCDQDQSGHGDTLPVAKL